MKNPCRDNVVVHITMQQPQPFLVGFSGSGSGQGGFALGEGAIPIGGVVCTFGIALYPVPPVGGLVRGFGSGLLDLSGHAGDSASDPGDFPCSELDLAGSGLTRGGLLSSDRTAKGPNSRSYVDGVLPSFSHCSCCILFA